MNQPDIDLSWLGPSAPKTAEAPVEAQQPDHQADLGLTSGISPPIRIHLFRGLKTDTVGRVHQFDSRPAARQHLTEAGSYASKDDCPMFSAGIFNGPIAGRTPTEFTLVVGEHDAGTVSVDEAIARLQKAGVAAFLYTSPSHTPGTPRWRVVAPLQAPCGPEAYPEYLDLLNGALGGCLAPESADRRRRWFYGRVEGAAEYRVEVAKGGKLLDDLAAAEHAIESVEVRPPKPKTSVAASAPPAGPATDADINRAISALSAIPNDSEQRLPYDRWRDLAMALHAATGGAQRALDALIDWTGDGQEAKTAVIWNGFRLGGGIGPGTLYQAAHDAGWVDPSRVPSIEGLTDLVGEAKAKLVGEARAADALGMADALPGMAHLVSEAAQLPEDDRVEVFDKMREVVGDDITERFAAAVRGTDAAIGRAKASAAPKVTAQALIAQFRVESREQVIATWADRAARLPRTEAEEVVAEVERLTGIKPRKLAGALNEARASAAKEQARRAFEKKRAGRVEIEVEKGEVGSMSRAAERAIVARGVPGAYLNFAGTPVCVRVDQLPNTHLIDDGDASAPPVPQFKPFNDPLMRVTVEGAVIFVGYDVKGRPRREDVPPPVVAQMLQNPSDSVPKVSGLLAHPVVLPDGTLLAKDGLHERTGLYLHGARVDGLRPYTRAEAAEAVARLREGLFREFEFASALDALVALAGLFTAMHRRLMPSSPGLAVLASRQSSGKTTLARVIHLATTGHDMPVTTLSESTEELKKHLFALLLRSPEMVCVDNIADGYTFRSPALAAMMTTDVYCDRVLGQSENRQVRTNTFWVITGNNLSLGADEITRWMVCRLEPSMARPEERRFKHADVAQMVSRLRPQILRDVVGVVWGYLKSDQGAAPSSGSRYPVWDRLVRLPLIWAGAGDVAEVFAKNRESSPDEIAKAGLLSALYDLSDGAVFRAIDVKDWLQGSFAGDGVAVLPGGKHEAVRRLRAALAESRVKNADAPSTSSIGRVLNGSAGACVETERGPLRLARRGTKEATAWQVELRG